MIEDQIIKRGIQDQRVLDIMGSIDRQKFVSKEYAQSANNDGPLPIGHGQTISQPFIVAFMSENLKIDASHKVLEIGTGSGYQSAVLSNLSNHVHTIEIIDELAKEASSRLNELGYNNITVHSGDGYKGLSEEAPFDRIMVTAAPKEIPEILVKQLSEGGMMILPMGEEFDIQHLWVVTKEGDGSIKKEKVLPVRFVPMVKK
ncbi:MAG: protein-L-isoaspartate O-methyltransferase [Candidatus Marinimicrobia bacterium]|nr:protein-L-isoaspartate O-methyltransferase [Candidatus Neomarinimicrobiota bacterium]|tara:strand:- start:512 stop:1117 length:606 start_codon:yes stop_codon:yes gene_type:complete